MGLISKHDVPLVNKYSYPFHSHAIHVKKGRVIELILMNIGTS